MSELKELIRKAQVKRDSQIKRWIGQGKGPSWIGRQLSISRQRAQQLVRRLNGRTS